MKLLFGSLFMLCTLLSQGQTINWVEDALLFNPEILIGKTLEANVNFPQTKPQKQLIFNIGRYQSSNKQEWAMRLKSPKTGYSFGITDFGNIDSLGLAFSLMPFIEFKAFRSNRFSILAGMGASFVTKTYNAKTNPRNQAVTTHITWATRTYLYYQFLSTKNIDLRLGVGYSHHSNGHTRLHNKGYNSYLLSLSTAIKNPQNNREIKDSVALTEPPKSVFTYFSARAGLGQNSFSTAFNKTKGVYSISGEYGKVYNNTLKIGFGFYFRYYDHYYDYIKGKEWMVRNGKEFDYFKSAPVYYSTNLGVNFNAEVLMNHVSIDLQIGLNLHKPAYKLDWRINTGWENTPKEIPADWVMGEYNRPYKIKQLISGRLGLKYYLLGLEKNLKTIFTSVLT